MSGLSLGLGLGLQQRGASGGTPTPTPTPSLYTPANKQPGLAAQPSRVVN